jgi:hypothetical protein
MKHILTSFLLLGGAAVWAQPITNGLLNSKGIAVATDGTNLVASSANRLDFWKRTAPRTWTFVNSVPVSVYITSLSIYKSSALAKHTSGALAFENPAGSAWVQTQSFNLPDYNGSNILYFNSSVWMSAGNDAVVGTPNVNAGQGAAHVLRRASAGQPWQVVQTLWGSTRNAGWFGAGVQLGTAGAQPYLLVSIPYSDGAAGSIAGFGRNSQGTYVLAGGIPSPTTAVARFGESLSGEAGLILVGAPANLGFSGSAHLYQIKFSAVNQMDYTLRQTLTLPGAQFFGRATRLTSSAAVISSGSTLSWYPVASQSLGMPTALPAPSPSNLWGVAVTMSTQFVVAGDLNANNGAGLLRWYE